MDAHEQPDAEWPSAREDLGISTGLMEWFETAPWVIEGRLVTRSPGGAGRPMDRPTLSRFQVELPSRRWLVEGMGERRDADGEADTEE